MNDQTNVGTDEINLQIYIRIDKTNILQNQLRRSLDLHGSFPNYGNL